MALSLQGLLGNPAFQSGMGLLSAGYNKTINPYVAADQGLLSAQNFQDQQEQLAFKRRQQAALEAAQLQLKTLYNPQSYQIPGMLAGQQDPLADIPPAVRQTLGPLAGINPQAAATDLLSLYGHQGRPANPHQNFIGPPLLLTNGHAGQMRVNPNDQTQPQLWDASTSRPAEPGVGIAAQPTLQFDPSNQGWVTSKVSGPTPVGGLSAADVTERKLGNQTMETQFTAKQNLPDLELRAAKVSSLVQYLTGEKDTAMAHGFATWFPTFPGSDTSNWKAVQASLKGMNFVGGVMDLKAASTNGSTGFGALNETEGANIQAATNDMMEATSQKDFEDAGRRLVKYTNLATANARRRAGLAETDDAYAPWKRTPVTWGQGIVPGAVPDPTTGLLTPTGKSGDPNAAPAGVDPAVWARYHKAQ